MTYRLDITPAAATDPIPQLDVLRGAVTLGDAGGTIANGAAADPGTVATNRGVIEGEAAGTDPHATSRGLLRFEGKSAGDTNRIAVQGSTDASLLQFDVNGNVDAAVVNGGNG